MLFLTLEDLSGTLEVIVFPDVYKQTRNIALSNSAMLIIGTIETGRGQDELFLNAETIKQLPGFGSRKTYYS